jgi:2'-5' RNA ligase
LTKVGPTWDNHTITWKNEIFTFALIFDIPAEFEAGGSFSGPEDPRIIIEGVQDAEPVIIFDMISGISDRLRTMWIFRPFSSHSTVLTIRGAERPIAEKN